MTREEAARVLREMDLRTMRIDRLYDLSNYLCATPGKQTEDDL